MGSLISALFSTSKATHCTSFQLCASFTCQRTMEAAVRAWEELSRHVLDMHRTTFTFRFSDDI